MQDLWRLSATDLAALIKSKKVSAREAATAALARLDAVNPKINAVDDHKPAEVQAEAGSAVAAGIGHIAHGTDIACSLRYPAYANGVHGLRPTVERIAAFNAALPERTIGAQISAVSGPLARTIADLRVALAAMSGFDPRDPWWVPAPLDGPARAKRAA